MLKSLHTSRLKRQSSTMGNMVRAAGGTKDSSTSCTILDAELAGLRTLLRQKELELSRKISIHSSSGASRVVELEREVFALKSRADQLSASHKKEKAALESAISKITHERDRCSKQARSIKLQLDEIEKGLLTSRRVIDDETSRKMNDDARIMIEKIKKEKALYEEQVARLNSENTDLRNQLANEKNSAADASALRAQLDKNMSETRKLEKKLADETKKIEKMEGNERNAAAEIQASRDRIAELTRLNSELETQKNKTLAAIGPLKAKLGDLKQHLHITKDGVVKDAATFKDSLIRDSRSIQQKIIEKETEIGDLKRTISANAAEISEIQRNLELCGSKEKELTDRIALLESEQSDLRSQLANQKSSSDVEASELKKELTRTQSELRNLREELTKTKEDHTNERGQLEANARKSQETQNELGVRIAELTERNSKLEAQKRETQLQINNLSKELVELKLQLDTTRAETKRNVESNQKKLSYDIQLIQQKLDEKEKNVRDFELKISSNADEMREVRKQLSECKKAEETQAARIEELGRALQDALTKEGEYTKEKKSTDARLADLNKQITELELSVARCKEQNQRLGRSKYSDTKSLNSDIFRLNEELERCKKELENEKLNKRRLEENIGVNKTLIDGLSEDKRVLDDTIRESKAENEVLNASITEKDVKYHGLKEQHNLLLVQIEESNKKIAELEGRLQSTVANTTARIESIRMELLDAEERASAAIKENENLKQVLASSVEENKELGVQKAEKNKEIEMLKGSIRIKERKLDKMKDEIKSKRAEITALNAALASSNRENSETNEEMERKSAELSAMIAEKVSLEAELASKSNRLIDIEMQSKAKEDENKELRRSLMSLQEESGRLVSTAASVQQERDEIQLELSKIEKLFSDEDDATNKGATPRDRLQGVAKNLDDLKTTMSDYCDGNETLTTCARNLIETVGSLKEGITQVNNKHNLEMSILVDGTESRKGEALHDRALRYIKMSKDILTHAITEGWVASDDPDKTSQVISSIGSKSVIEDLENRNMNLRKQKEQLDQDRGILLGEIEGKNNHIKNLEESVKKLNRAVGDKTSEISALESSKSALERDIVELDDLRGTNTALKNTNKTLTTANRNLTDALEEAGLAQREYEGALDSLRSCTNDLAKCVSERGAMSGENETMRAQLSLVRSELEKERAKKAKVLRTQANVARFTLDAHKSVIREAEMTLEPIIRQEVANSVAAYRDDIHGQVLYVFERFVEPMIQAYKRSIGSVANQPSRSDHATTRRLRSDVHDIPSDTLASASAGSIGPKSPLDTTFSKSDASVGDKPKLALTKNTDDDNKIKNIKDNMKRRAGTIMKAEKINEAIKRIQNKLIDLSKLQLDAGSNDTRLDDFMAIIPTTISSYITTEIDSVFSGIHPALFRIGTSGLMSYLEKNKTDADDELAKIEMTSKYEEAHETGPAVEPERADEGTDEPDEYDSNEASTEKTEREIKLIEGWLGRLKEANKHTPIYKGTLKVLLLFTRHRVYPAIQHAHDKIKKHDVIRAITEMFQILHMHLEREYTNTVKINFEAINAIIENVRARVRVSNRVNTRNEKKSRNTEMASEAPLYRRLVGLQTDMIDMLNELRNPDESKSSEISDDDEDHDTDTRILLELLDAHLNPDTEGRLQNGVQFGLYI